MRRKQYNPFYFIGQAFHGLFRNLSATFGSLFVLICCLVLIGSSFLLMRNVTNNLDNLSLMNKIVVFLEYDTTPERANDIRREIEGYRDLGNLKVQYISKKEALQNLIDESEENAELYGSIPEADNPLADSFVIEYDDASKVSSLDYKLRQIEGVRKVNNRLDLAVKVNAFKNGMAVVFFFFFVALMAVGVFVIINTVNLSVMMRADEIYVMRYVGASRVFIALPFILEGTILGAAAAGASYFIVRWLNGYVIEKFSANLEMIRIAPFSESQQLVLWGFFGIGILAGVIGSTISIRRPMDA